MSFRKEKKFLAGQSHTFTKINNFLFFNKFKKIYPDRKIYSVYFDNKNLDMFSKICEKENAPYAVVGVTTHKRDMILERGNERYVNMPLSKLFNLPKLHRISKTVYAIHEKFDTSKVDINKAALDILRLPTVGSKSFLITIGDRSVTGLVSRDQILREDRFGDRRRRKILRYFGHY